MSTAELVERKTSDLLDLIVQLREEARSENEAREAVAKSVAGSKIEGAWAELQTLAGPPSVYTTLDMTLTRGSSGKTAVMWKYYDEKAKHIESPSLKSLLDKVRAAKAEVVPDTLADVVEAIEYDRPF